MTSLVVFVEEPSARIVVEHVLARLLPGKHVIIVQHEGKSDLKASFSRKIAAWQHPKAVPFIVLHDNDGSDCATLKHELTELVTLRCRARTRVRIVMQCLESWYLGDPTALEASGLVKPTIARKIENSQKFRNPDRLVNAKDEFFRLHTERGQLALARRIAPHLDPQRSRSHSFRLLARTAIQLTS